jgi:hypothetical protein
MGFLSVLIVESARRVKRFSLSFIEIGFDRINPDRKGLIKIISTRYFLVIKEINKYLVDMILIHSFWSGDDFDQQQNYLSGRDASFVPSKLAKSY